MKQPSQNQAGFTHPVIFVIIIVLIVGLLIFTGKRVFTATKQKPVSQPVASSTVVLNSEPVSTTSNPTTKSAPKKVTVKKTGTAAATVPATSPSTPTQLQLTTDNNLQTPEGSLNQLLQELKSKDFSNALYFITPRFMQATSQLLHTSGPATYQQCQANTTCNMLLTTNINNLQTSQIKNYAVASVSAEGKSLLFNAQLKNGVLTTQTSGPGEIYHLQIDMLHVDTNWVVDHITVNGYSI